MVHICFPITGEAEAENYKFEASLGTVCLKLKKKKKANIKLLCVRLIILEK